MKYPNVKSVAGAAAIVATLFFASGAGATTPTSWKDSSFSIDANGMRLRDVLNQFGQAYGVRVSIKVPDQTQLKGRLKGETGSDFLDRLKNEYNFAWFVYSGTLYIVPRSDFQSVRLDIGEDAVQDAKAALIGVGLFDTRFGWGELPDDGVVLINGPREYVKLAREVLMPESDGDDSSSDALALPLPGAPAPLVKTPVYKGKQVMVFRLKYASATDRVITVRGEKQNISGIKTILMQTLGQIEPSTSSGSEMLARDRLDLSSEKRSRNTRLGRDANDAADANAPKGRSSKNAPVTPDGPPRIDADATQNAVIIYDVASRRPMYQALIDALDLEPQQVEIEALIVDVDRTQLMEHGAEWGFVSGKTTGIVNSTNGNSQGTNQPLSGSTILLSNANFYARLKELASSGDANILAKPTVLTLDNVEAVLDLTQTRYVPLVGERVSDLADVTAGTMLRVVPRVLRENGTIRVKMDVNIEDGKLGNSSQGQTDATRSTISTQAIVNEQQTLMIGGYHVESANISDEKTPILGDIPLVGSLFHSSKDLHKDRERLFLLTPRLVGTVGTDAARRSTTARIASEFAKEERRKSPDLEDREELQKRSGTGAEGGGGGVKAGANFVPLPPPPRPSAQNMSLPVLPSPNSSMVQPAADKSASNRVASSGNGQCTTKKKPSGDALNVDLPTVSQSHY